MDPFALLPTRLPPAPEMASAGDPRVAFDRLLAAAIDLLVCYLLVETPLIYAVSVVAPGPYDALGAAVVPLSLVALVPIYLTYSFAFEWRTARTPGKVARGLVVVTTGGDPCSLRASAVRNLLRYVDLLGVGVVLVVLGPRGRRVGDHLAGTVVVRAVPHDRESVLAETGETLEDAGTVRGAETEDEA